MPEVTTSSRHYEPTQISMDFIKNGKPWNLEIFIDIDIRDINARPWLSMDANGDQWISMDVHGFMSALSMDIDEIQVYP